MLEPSLPRKRVLIHRARTSVRAGRERYLSEEANEVRTACLL